jgi:hypothetical protein
VEGGRFKVAIKGLGYQNYKGDVVEITNTMHKFAPCKR